MNEIWLAAHNIRSTYNVGSIFRTAEGFGVKKILISGYTPFPKMQNSDPRLPHIAEKLDKQIAKVALGAEKIVPFEYFEDFDSVLSKAKSNGLQIIALEQHPKSQNLANFHYQQPLLLILGEEVNGIDTNILDKADTILEIPMVGQKESFNVASATAIALFQLSLTR